MIDVPEGCRCPYCRSNAVMPYKREHEQHSAVCMDCSARAPIGSWRKLPRSPFDAAEAVLHGRRWTEKEATALKRLIDIGTG